MRFTDEVNWTVSDFAFAAGLLLGVGLVFEVTLRLTANAAYRTAVAVALTAAFLLVWVNGAVGIIGSERNPANLMYAGVLAVALAGAIVARFRPGGMAWALAATALAQAAVGAIALDGDLGAEGEAWPRDVLVLTGGFGGLWLLSAALFGTAARPRRGTRAG
jgi:hypothetical protein